MKTYLTILALSAAFAISAQAQVIYQDNFDNTPADGFLNGEAPDTVSGTFGTTGAIWEAAEPATNGFKADGSADGVDGQGGFAAYLPFTPTGGTANSIYRLDVDLIWNSGNYLSLGFNPGSDAVIGGGSRPSNSNGVAWMLTTDDLQSYFKGPNAAGQIGANTTIDLNNPSGPNPTITYSIILDMTAGTNSTDIEFLVNGVSQRSATGLDYSSTAAITKIQLALNANKFDSSGTFESLTLTQIPEPQNFALMAGFLGLVSIMLRRRIS